MSNLSRIERMLDLPDADKAEVMAELSSHYEERRIGHGPGTGSGGSGKAAGRSASDCV